MLNSYSEMVILVLKIKAKIKSHVIDFRKKRAKSNDFNFENTYTTSRTVLQTLTYILQTLL